MKKILLGISSSISIYKIPNLIRILQNKDCEIKVIMTENATKLVNKSVFQTISKNKVWIDQFDDDDYISHITLTDWADIFVIAPATANIISKAANGIADDLLSTSILAFNKRIIFFPAMNVKMYENKALQNNIKKLLNYGYEVIEPVEGKLACGYEGKGKLPAEQYIADIILKEPHKPLKGKRFIVTTGGTIEKIDPVRYISNFSSGKMGLSIAKVLYNKGAEVLLLYGNIKEEIPSYLKNIHFESSLDLLEKIKSNINNYDGIFMAAAVSDYRAEYSSKKIKKDNNTISLNLIKNPDILKEIKDYKGIKVGFSLETDNAIENSIKKLNEKNLDYIILNEIDDSFNPLGSEYNKIKIISKDNNIFETNLKTKEEIAEIIINKVFKL